MNPYKELSSDKFWKNFVSSRSFFDITDVWDPKFKIAQAAKVSTFGSCFAQHIGRALQDRGYTWFVTERAPIGMSVKSKRVFNYDVFSARTGNIYTVGLLKQWLNWAFGKEAIPEEIWLKNDRYFDPFRPKIEPNGFDSIEELRESRNYALQCFRSAIENSDIFVYTLGLTETWVNSKYQYEYPMAPGTVAGEFNPNVHEFINKEHDEIHKELKDAFSLIKSVNKKIKIILTVSPVPLTATYSSSNVLIATMYSKSVLRSVAGLLAKSKNVDYFPSYEIVASPCFGGAFYEPNKRTVNPRGVDFVMESFFSCLDAKFGAKSHKKNSARNLNYDLVCEEEILEVFSK